MNDTHLEAWADWHEWITMGIYSHDQCDQLQQREATLTAQGYTLRRMQY
jgi:hypothetical protein